MALAVSNDDSLLVSGSRDCSVSVLDIATGKQLHIRYGSDAVFCVAISSNNAKVAFGGDNYIKEW